MSSNEALEKTIEDLAKEKPKDTPKPKKPIYLVLATGDGNTNIYLSRWILGNAIQYGMTYQPTDLFYPAECERRNFVIQVTDFSMAKPLENNANWIVRKFLKSDCEYLLWVDDDIVPDALQLERLIDAEKDIVGASVLIMKPGLDGPRPCVMKKRADGKYEFMNMCVTDDKFLECDFIGFGCILIHRRVFEAMSKPYFKKSLDIDGKMTTGTDLYFCEQVKKLGFKIYADNQKLCGQIVEVNLFDWYKKTEKLCQRTLDLALGKKTKKIKNIYT